MQGEQRGVARLENVERGTRPWIDLEQPKSCVFDQEVDAVEPDQRRDRYETLDGVGQAGGEPRGNRGGSHGAAVAKRCTRRGARPLRAESEHDRRATIAEDERRDRRSGNTPLV